MTSHPGSSGEDVSRAASRLQKIFEHTAAFAAQAKVQEMARQSTATLESATRLQAIFEHTAAFAAHAKVQEMARQSTATLESATRLQAIFEHTAAFAAHAKVQEMARQSTATLESTTRLQAIFEQTAQFVSAARLQDLARDKSAEILETLNEAASEGRVIAEQFDDEVEGLSEIGDALVSLAAETSTDPIPADGVEWDATDGQILFWSIAITLAALLSLGLVADPPTRKACIVLIGFLGLIGTAALFAPKK